MTTFNTGEFSNLKAQIIDSLKYKKKLFQLTADKIFPRKKQQNELELEQKTVLVLCIYASVCGYVYVYGGDVCVCVHVGMKKTRTKKIKARKTLLSNKADTHTLIHTHKHTHNTPSILRMPDVCIICMHMCMRHGYTKMDF